MSEIDDMIDPKGNKVLLLLGNEAIARGVIEAGVASASTYPGTPSSEVGDVLYRVARKVGMRFEYSVNEKVALEVSFAASTLGLRSFVFMKHVGLNVAADALMSISYSGVKGGLVIMSADDPSMHSSQNEQDNRLYGQLAHIPVIEPSTPQEAKDFIISAFELSERYHIPVLFRTTTRVSHERSAVKTGPVERIRKSISFDYGKMDFNSLPSLARQHKLNLERKMREIAHDERISLNRMIEREGSWGAITSGVGYSYLTDVIEEYDLPVSMLKLGLTNPLQDNIILDFMRKYSNIIIVEELDPYLETKIRALAQLNGISVKIYGKMDGYFPTDYEYDGNVVLRGVARAMGLKIDEKAPEPAVNVTPRPPVLCPGCPHRASFFIVKRALRMLKIDDAIISSDIGCYSLGALDPFDMGDIIISMGTSVGYSSGMVPEFGKRSVTFIGDSTLFHGGLPGIVNAVKNNAQTTIIVLDNRTTAMTGQQPTPSALDPAYEDDMKEISIESTLKGIGVSKVVEADPYDLKDMLHKVTDCLKTPGVTAIIARRECAILRDRKIRRVSKIVPYHVIPDKCTGCFRCVTDFSCPAMSIKGNKVVIDAALCDGCGVCAERFVCPYGAIEVDENAE